MQQCDRAGLLLQIYQRTCPVKANVCQPAGSIENTGVLNAQGETTSSVITDPSAPIFFLIGNAGAVSVLQACFSTFTWHMLPGQLSGHQRVLPDVSQAV